MNTQANPWRPFAFVSILVLLAFLPILLSRPATQSNPPIPKPSKPIDAEAKKRSISHDQGRAIYMKLKNKVCEELDLCWIASGYNAYGDKILKKEFPTTWGSKRSLIIPRSEWNSLSYDDREQLGTYLEGIGVVNITVGRILPARYADDSINPDRNTITVDETVWGI